MRPTSRAGITSATHGSRPACQSSITAASIMSRSASGSATLPNCDSTRQRRARKPSIWSVIAATPNTIAAGQLCPWSEERTSATKTGMSASRTSVSAFGSCASGAGTARVAIRAKDRAQAQQRAIRPRSARDNDRVSNGDSQWSDDQRWQVRLEADAARLSELLTADDREVIDGTIAAADGDGSLEFAVVYGSVARGERRANSDLDIYFEASDLPREFNRTDPNCRWHVFGLPPGALLDNLRRRQQFAFDLIQT